MRATWDYFIMGIAIDRLRFLHIIPPNKNRDEDEYARYDGIVVGEVPAIQRAGEMVKVLPETTAPNGPLSCRAKLV
jgi:hypothetical protein